MIRFVLILGVVSACSGDDGGPAVVQTGECIPISREVTQRFGTCRIDSNPDQVGHLDGCWTVAGALCGSDGARSSCPTEPGWEITCDRLPDGSQINCTYVGACTPVSDGVEFNYVQTLDGVDGIAVVSINADLACEFRRCL